MLGQVVDEEGVEGKTSYTHTDTAGDLVKVIQRLGGPAVIVGQSFSGGAATMAAAKNPELLSAVVEIDPFTRPPKTSVSALLRNTNNYRRGALPLGQFIFTGNVKAWSKYLNVAFPGSKPADWDTWLAALQTNLREPGRVKAAQKMANSKESKVTLKEAAVQLANLRCPALVVMGGEDSDFPDPEAEAATIVGLLPSGLGRFAMIDNAGHYPHAQYPQEVAGRSFRSSPNTPMPRAGLTTALVTQEAGKLADEVGFENLTLSALALRLGLRQPSIYKHVNGTADLHREMTMLAKTQLADVMRRAAVGRARDEALLAIAVAYRAWAIEHTGLYATTVRAATPGDVDDERAALEALEVIYDVLEGYDLSGDDTIEATRALRALLHGFVTLQSGGSFGYPIDIDHSFLRAIEGLISSFRQWNLSCLQKPE